MDLGQVLQAAGLNRNSYNTMVRRAGLDFMRFPYSGPAAARYQMWHAVCLGAVLELQDGGMALEHASRAITACQDQLRIIVEQATIEWAPPTWLSIEFPRHLEATTGIRSTLAAAPIIPDAENTRFLIAVNLVPRIRSTLLRAARAADQSTEAATCPVF